MRHVIGAFLLALSCAATAQHAESQTPPPGRTDTSNSRSASPDPNQVMNLAPQYPTVAILKGHKGTVVVVADIDDAGKPLHVSVRQSSRYPELDGAAIQAMRAARFPPGAPGKVELPISFGIDANPRHLLDMAISDGQVGTPKPLSH